MNGFYETPLLLGVIAEMTDREIIDADRLAESVIPPGKKSRYWLVYRMLEKLERHGYAARLDNNFWTLTR